VEEQQTEVIMTVAIEPVQPNESTQLPEAVPTGIETEQRPADPISGNGEDQDEALPLDGIQTDVQSDAETRMVTIMLESTGDRQRDSLRLRRVHGLLTSFPGTDHFAFLLYEASRRYHLEFPNSTTGYCPELHGQLVDLLGEGVVRVEALRIQ
jgi:hypothetical protein